MELPWIPAILTWRGGHATASQEDYVEYHGLLAWAAAFAAAWIIIRFVGGAHRCLSTYAAQEEKGEDGSTMTITYEYEDALYVNLTNKCN